MLTLFHLLILVILLIEILEYESSKLHTVVIMSAAMFLVPVIEDIFDLPGTQLNIGYLLLSSVIALAGYNLIKLSIQKRRDKDDTWF